eukprot:gene801-1281_t
MSTAPQSLSEPSRETSGYCAGRPAVDEGENPEDAQRAWAEIVGSATNRQHRSAGSVSNSSMKWLLEGDTITEHKLEIQLDPDRVDAIMHGSLGQDESGQMSEVFSSGEKAPELYDNMNSVLQTVTSSMAVNEGFSERLKNMDLDTLGKLRSGLDERPSWVSTKHVLPQKQPASAVERAAVADEAAAKLRGSINQILMGSTSAAPECKDADPLQQRICAGLTQRMEANKIPPFKHTLPKWLQDEPDLPVYEEAAGGATAQESATADIKGAGLNPEQGARPSMQGSG